MNPDFYQKWARNSDPFLVPLSIGIFPEGSENGRILGPAFWCWRTTFELIFGIAQSGRGATISSATCSRRTPKCSQLMLALNTYSFQTIKLKLAAFLPSAAPTVGVGGYEARLLAESSVSKKRAKGVLCFAERGIGRFFFCSASRSSSDRSTCADAIQPAGRARPREQLCFALGAVLSSIFQEAYFPKSIFVWIQSTLSIQVSTPFRPAA